MSAQYERTYGEKYDPNEYDASKIAKRIRVDLKAAFPGVTFWVRTNKFSMGQSIDVYVDYPGVVRCPECQGQRTSWTYEGQHGQLCQTCATWAGGIHPDANAMADKVKQIHGAYNHDGSDTMTDYFDVKYYGTVHIGPPYDVVVKRRQSASA